MDADSHATISTLEDLHDAFSGEEILQQVRNFFTERDNLLPGITDGYLFIHATRDYWKTNEGHEEEAAQLHQEFLGTGNMPLKIARCLLPGYILPQK